MAKPWKDACLGFFDSSNNIQISKCTLTFSYFQYFIIVNAIFTFCMFHDIVISSAQEFTQPFITSITSLEVNHVLEAAKDPRGTHVIEAFLISDAAWKLKRKLITKYAPCFCTEFDLIFFGWLICVGYFLLYLFMLFDDCEGC